MLMPSDDKKIREVLLADLQRLTISEIAQRSGVPVDRVKEWAEQRQNASTVRERVYIDY